ncbi:tRNA (adenosine(37)-N6)-threonylcarbamoyltransferase complex dimerization subunit type 1 TsaB [Macrococcus hajekii]|uniref:tRNA (Adenosine(37)-N6)-threonylcarbamoyltransferase complex dimerization subunit type 1 TsaB n=1 Tax=Macrococcus hajekii TaxID=198482 RepID=A0A4R6BIE2_9STAP|nr:tRNA (adenosine(37)-N6)-threonylcarbamoyltransferase complex dimerization subunit type 1 TsaB [Macrococcus hajekii]TDM01389.1 tRNA (adenosine(37)-N6)-threonylcarbamoyltransferase complex dimerization subunit type 1 TsaB [Macrococcus hajekii]GGB11207.1 tRNA (adenosine(37)-N6)-threonylcarbamoyltransferase complex dimerization subunit type 1 TsaB [Macrococcus hajekii]
MILLNIDTANQPLSVSVTDDVEVLAEFNSAKKINHSVTLMPMIEKILQHADLDTEALEGITVSSGPGSYTGLRIGVTVAKTLAYTLGIPLYSVSSLKVLAATARMDEILLVPVIDARRKAVYSGIYRFKGRHIEQIEQDRYMTIEELNDYLKQQHMPYLFIGMDAVKLEEDLKGPVFYCIPRSSEMRHIVDFNQPEDIHRFEPTYLRMTEAERNWLKQQD